MAQSREIVTIYLAGAVQGLALVTFPAASTIFTSPAAYALSNTEYGGIFVPQALSAVAASLLGGGLRKRLGTRRIYLAGLVANLLAMSTLVLSSLVTRQHFLAYGALLFATACLGTGFGLTVPALNTFAAAFFPGTIDSAVLGLNALLGLGTALAPALVALFIGLGLWWGLPLLAALMLAGVLFVSLFLPLRADELSSSRAALNKKHDIPSLFWVFAAFVFLYGICETMNGNWASLYMKENLGTSPAAASFALTIFWSTVTAGRIFFAALAKWLPARLVGRVLSFVVLAAFLTLASLPRTSSLPGLIAFALAGFGCSTLLPLAISCGQQQLVSMNASVAAGLIAFYEMGYGLAAFGVGPLQQWAGLTLKTIYGGAAAVALAMAALSFVLTRKS